jgi:type III restriction enzyme
MSVNDIEKTFNLLCLTLLKEQTEDEAKIANISRSWSPLKSAFRVWMRSCIGSDSRDYYRILIADLAKGASSVIRPAVTQALKDYKPVLESIVSAKANQSRVSESYVFSIAEEYSYPADYERIETQLCALEALFVPSEDFGGKKNELDFVHFLESQDSAVEWWFKQGIGRDYFGVYYLNTATQKPAIFYPDWILKLKDGRILIVDTKAGRTATDTEGRAEGLAKKLETLGDQFSGGIVVKENAVWHLNSSPQYSYTPGKLSDDWKLFQDVLSNHKK